MIVNDRSSYGLIGLFLLGLVFYSIYTILYIRHNRSSLSRRTTTHIYIYIFQLSLLSLLIFPLTYLIRSTSILCFIQDLFVQILPFSLLLALNIDFIHQWLHKSYFRHDFTILIAFSSFLIFVLFVLVQTALLLVWFSNSSLFNQYESTTCTNECHRSFIFSSFLLQYLLLFLYGFQSSLRYHFSVNMDDFVYLLTSLLAIGIAVISTCSIVFLPLRIWLMKSIDSTENIFAYGLMCFAYAFLVPFLFEQLYYYRQAMIERNRTYARHVRRIDRLENHYLLFQFSISRSIRWHRIVYHWLKISNVRSWMPTLNVI
jgi:hypothetical protein